MALDIDEQILIRLGVKDLSRFKCVCKSWNSLISSSRFTKLHLTRNRTNDNIGRKRIAMMASTYCYSTRSYKANPDCHIVGSFNGLVCIARRNDEIFVSNPSTCELRRLQTPQLPYKMRSGLAVGTLCWGLGCDSTTDDYKVVVGVMIEGEIGTCFQMLSLKSNVWRFIGQVKYRFDTKVGILCNEALHWFMSDQNNQKVILSFDLSREEFKEIPQPDCARYECTDDSNLGVIEERLCIFRSLKPTDDKWVMKKYNVKESWAIISYAVNNDDVETCLDTWKDYRPARVYFGHVHIWLSKTIKDMSGCCLQSIASPHGNAHLWLYTTFNNIVAPVFVESLISPYVNATLKRKRQ